MVKEVPVYLGPRLAGWAKVDDEDYFEMVSWKWTLHSHGYATRWGGKGNVYMHREIARPAPGLIVDHVNGDKLDNRRSNLRAVGQSENQQNRMKRASKKGLPRNVNVQTVSGNFSVEVKVCGKRHYIGTYKDLGEAEAAARRAREELHPFGPDARAHLMR